MRLLHLNNKSLKAVLEKHGLTSKPILGRGMFSIVYDNGNSIIKCTLDRSTPELSMYYGNDNPHFPKVLDYIGLENIKLKNTEVFLFIYEIEKLKKHTEISNQFKDIQRVLYYNLKPQFTVESINHIKCIKDNELIQDALNAVVNYSNISNMYYDPTNMNFMYRDKTIVLNDVLVDANLFDNLIGHNNENIC